MQPKWHCKQIIIEECKRMSSAQLPLWISFKNIDKSTKESTLMMFKAGDDLRQDILTFSMIRVIDNS